MLVYVMSGAMKVLFDFVFVKVYICPLVTDGQRTLYDGRTRLRCVSKRIPDINDCNLKDYQILTIFGTNIPDTSGHLTTIHVSTSPSDCSCTTWRNQNKRHITFLFKVV